MKKVLDRIMVLLVALIIAAAMCGCGNKDAGKDSGSSASESAEEADAGEESEKEEKTDKKEEKSSGAPKIEEIEWNVDEGIVDGDRKVVMSLTNNSDYSLTGVDISFTEKDGITDDEKDAFYSDIKEKLDASDDDMEQLKDREISMHAKTERVIPTGESVASADMYYYQGYFYVKDLDHFGLVTPDIAEISYVDGDKIYKEYYDFKGKKYSMDDKTEEAQYWSKSALGSVVPKPEAPVIKDGGRDDDDCFMFEAYGMTIDDFNAYIDSCKDMGYTVDASEFDGFYSADNSEGYNVYMNYDNNRYSASVTVKSPDEDNEEDLEEAPDIEEGSDAPDPDTESEANVDPSDVTPSVKEALDEYEAFFDEYIAFMKKYNKADVNDLNEMIDEYSDYIEKYSNMYSKLIGMAGDMKIASDDYKYYSAVLKRIEKKLEDV